MRTTSFQHYLDQLYARFLDVRDGDVANYIPELAHVDADAFGMALVTVDGHVYQAGDSRTPFSIQSISKAFTYGIALEDQGPARVAEKIDVEPSGEAFNSISLEPKTGRPRNPMINAGAIVATSLVNGEDAAARLERILAKFEHYAGRPLGINPAIYESERSTGHRNRAIAHLLRNYEILEGDPEEPLDAYFRQCAIEVTARDLALMGATLANDGVNPITAVRALPSPLVPNVLAVMATCGMYDYSGNWIFQVGMPAKSGVGGGVVAVLPGQFGLAVYSPRLDAKGNSVRGIAVCESVSRDFGMHMLRVTRTTTHSVVRNTYTLADVHSNLQRDRDSALALREHGHRALVLELTGELMFVAAEVISSTVADAMSGRDWLILDLARVMAVDNPGGALLTALMDELIDAGKIVVIAGSDGHFAFRQAVRVHFNGRDAAPVFDYADVDRALEYVEDRILESIGLPSHEQRQVHLDEQPLCKGLAADELDLFRSLLDEQSFRPGQVICAEGEAADFVYLLRHGRVRVSLTLDNKHNHRLGAYTAGWVFGESALFSDHNRSADIIADTNVSLYRLDPARLEQPKDARIAALKAKLFANLAELSLDRLVRANHEIRVLTK
ncbi:glutaminase A [Marinihelvus fidelis]|uniref:glutaminase A n=1 Tax=Marinihelvus fidelis TaxID=2613842 RepID=UPI0017823604|nr:glutaminase A [Marinihelvus fidelis]